MISANKQYKESGSDLPFKEWLRREQLKGNLDVHKEKFLNVAGEEEEPETEIVDDGSQSDMPPMITTKEAKRNRNFALVIGVVAGMLISKYVFKK